MVNGLANTDKVPLAWLTSRLQTCRDRDKMTRFFLSFFFSFLTL